MYVAFVVNACNYTGTGVIGDEAITRQRTLAAPRCLCSAEATALRVQIGTRIHRLVAIACIPTAGLAQSVGAAARHRLSVASPHICGYVAVGDCLEVAFGAGCGNAIGLPGRFNEQVQHGLIAKI